MTKLNHILIRRIFFINFSQGLEVDFSTDKCIVHLNRLYYMTSHLRVK